MCLYHEWRRKQSTGKCSHRSIHFQWPSLPHCHFSGESLWWQRLLAWLQEWYNGAPVSSLLLSTWSGGSCGPAPSPPPGSWDSYPIFCGSCGGPPPLQLSPIPVHPQPPLPTPSRMLVHNPITVWSTQKGLAHAGWHTALACFHAHASCIQAKAIQGYLKIATGRQEPPGLQCRDCKTKAT